MIKKIVTYALLAAMGAILIGPFAAKIMAPVYNNLQLSRVERLVSQELHRHEIQYRLIDSSIHGESYFMIGDEPRDTWRQSCIYYITIALEEDPPQDANKVSAFTSTLADQLGEDTDFSVRRRGNLITVTKSVSIPLGSSGMVSRNSDNTSTLLSWKWLRPWPLYDGRCRTTMRRNGA